MEKVYVDENNKAFVICPKCGFEKNVDATNFRNMKNEVKGKCNCSKGFDFTLEYRKHYRKNVMLPGEYVVQKSGEKGEAIFKKLSLSGIQFESLRPHQISTDDIVGVKFKLDNPLKSEIRRFAKVIWVKNRNVGAQFSETKDYDKALGFYLKK
jgi:tRNA U34 2-thiouridine synthase MnmA/TrmU